MMSKMRKSIRSLRGKLRSPGCPPVLHRTALAPADDASAEHVHHQRHVDPTLPGRDIGEVRDPELVLSISTELPVDPVQRARGLRVRDGGALGLAPAGTLQSLASHQALDGTPRHRDALAVELEPDLVSAIDLHVGLPHPVYLRHQDRIALDTARTQFRAALARGMVPVGRWGDLQNTADRLDPKLLPVLIDEVLQDLMRRSSSAWAKNAVASFRISLALHSSRTSRSKSLMRWASSVETP